MKDDPLYRPLPDSFEPPPPPAAPPRKPGFSWCLALSVLLWFGGVLAALWFVVPKFAEVYEQIKVPMPSATLTILALSDLALRGWWAFAPASLALAAWTGTWRGRPATLLRVLVPLAFMATVGFVAFGLFLPLCGTLGRCP